MITKNTSKIINHIFIIINFFLFHQGVRINFLTATVDVPYTSTGKRERKELLLRNG